MINIFEWKPVKSLKLTLDNGLIIIYNNLKDTIIKFNQTDSINGFKGYKFTIGKSLQMILKSKDAVQLTRSCSIEIEYEEIVIIKNKPYIVKIEINKMRFNNNSFEFYMGETLTNYEYELILDSEGKFLNICLNSCGIQYTKEDDRKKIIVNEPSVVYILKDKETSKKYRGYARCLEGDKFDDNVGINIVRLKAEIKKKEYQLLQLTI